MVLIGYACNEAVLNGENDKTSRPRFSALRVKAAMSLRDRYAEHTNYRRLAEQTSGASRPCQNAASPAQLPILWIEA